MSKHTFWNDRFSCWERPAIPRPKTGQNHKRVSWIRQPYGSGSQDVLKVGGKQRWTATCGVELWTHLIHVMIWVYINEWIWWKKVAIQLSIPNYLISGDIIVSNLVTWECKLYRANHRSSTSFQATEIMSTIQNCQTMNIIHANPCWLVHGKRLLNVVALCWFVSILVVYCAVTIHTEYHVGTPRHFTNINNQASPSEQGGEHTV